MKIETVKLVYFSPTQTTKKVLSGIAQGIQVAPVEPIDLTLPEARSRKFEEMHDELAIIGAPVYGGRIPLDAVHRLQQLKAHDTPAVVVVLYGNRAYEDALLELKDLAVAASFRPLAGGAFIGEHSYASDTTPIANGRPDPEDLQKAVGFGKMIRQKMADIHGLDEISPLQVPGDFPYKQRKKPPAISPVTQEALCTRCESCVAVCPTAAITVRDTVMTDPNACILCCACVKNCPSSARVMEDSRIRQTADWLSKNCGERKEPEIYV